MVPKQLCKPHWGSLGSSPQPCSLKLSPFYTLSSLKLHRLLQSPPGHIQPPVPGCIQSLLSQAWGGEENTTLPHVPYTGPSQLLPLFRDQRSHPGFTDSLGWLLRFMASIF